jgi:hypothetical protein
MAITRLQQARQMYALGQRVAKTMDGSRPGYRGPGGYQGNGSGPAGGASAGGNYGGDSSGGVNPNDMSGAGDRSYDFKGPADLGVTTRSANTISPPDVDRGAVGQFSTYGKNVFANNLKGPTLGQKISQGVGNFASGVGDFITSGGMIGGVLRGLGSLFNPPAPSPSTGNVGPAGMTGVDQYGNPTYGTVEDAIRASRRNEFIEKMSEGGEDGGGKDENRGNDIYIPSLYGEDETIEDIDGDGIISLQDIVLRFQGADETLNPQAVGLQDTDQLRAMIQERVKNLYT